MNAIQTSAQVKLPTLNLPSFSGLYEQWLCFYDTFNSLIHENNTLTNIQKFHYLKSCLTSDAAQVIESLGLSSDNYQTAWTLLKERYQNKRLIIQNHINALFSLAPVTKDSPVSLRHLLDNVLINIRALNTLGMPTDTWDMIIIHLITSKFDFSTKKEWESLATKELPTMQDMTTFLTNRCQMLEAVNLNRPSTSKHTPPTHFTTKKSHIDKSIQPHYTSHMVTHKPQCTFCKGMHYIRQCADLLNLPIETRFKEIKSRRLCVNCLKQGHKTSDCLSGSCQKCQKRHHTLLHANQMHHEGANLPYTNITQQHSATLPHVNHAPQQSETDTISTQPSTVANHCQFSSSSQVILSTALIYVYELR